MKDLKFLNLPHVLRYPLLPKKVKRSQKHFQQQTFSFIIFIIILLDSHCTVKQNMLYSKIGCSVLAGVCLPKRKMERGV